MALTLVINGLSYSFPETGDESWGDAVTSWAQAVSQGLLQKSGGLFQLSAEVDFGTSYGLKTLYYKSRTANAASSGQIRLANSDSISFRNSTNDGNIQFKPGSTDLLPQYAGIDLVNLSSAQTLTNKTLTLPTLGGFTASRALQTSGLGVIQVASVSSTELGRLVGIGSAAVGISDVNTLTNKSIDADTNTLTNIANASVKTGAAIDGVKISPIFGNQQVTTSQGFTSTAANGQIVLGATAATVTLSMASVPGAARIISIPAPTTDDSFALLAHTQTLTNKTLTAPVIATIVNTGTLTLPTSTDTLVGKATTDILTNKSMSGSSNTFTNLPTSALTGAVSAVNGGTGVANNVANTITFSGSFSLGLTLTAGTSVTLPTTGTLATLAGSEILTNKTMGSTNTLTGATAASFSNSGTITLPTGTRTLVARDTTDTLTNKDFDGGAASNSLRLTIPKNTLSALTALTRKQATLVYGSDTNKLYADNGTLLVEVGSGASGSINYLPLNSIEWNFESNATTGYATYANTVAAATPEVSPGGTPSANVTFASTATTPLLGTYSALFTKDAANRQGTGVRTSAFTIDNIFKSQTLTIQAYFSASSGYVAGDVGVYISDGTSIISPTTVSLPGGNGLFQATFVGTTSTSYRLYFHIATTSAVAYTIEFDNISVGPANIVTGPGISDWTSYTPTFVGLGTVTSNVAYYRRVGDTLQVKGFCVTGTATATAMTITLPSGLAIDTTKISASKAIAFGMIYRATSTPTTFPTTSIGPWAISVDTSVTSTVYISANANTANTQFTPDGNLFGNSNGVSYHFEVPIAGWSSNVQLANNNQEFVYNTDTTNADNTSSFGYGTSGAAVPNRTVGTSVSKRIRFQTPPQVTDVLTVEIQQGGITNPRWERWDLLRGPHMFQGTSVYGVSIQPVSGTLTDFDVVFNAQGFRSNNATYAGNGSGFDTLFSNGDLWRVRKSAGVNSTQIEQGGAIRAAGYKTSTQTCSADVETEVILNTKRFDTNNALSTATGRFTAPRNGVLICTFTAVCTMGATPSTLYQAYFKKNGTGDFLGTSFTSQTTASKDVPLTSVAVIPVIAGDYVSAWIKTSSQAVTLENTGGTNDVNSVYFTYIGFNN